MRSPDEYEYTLWGVLKKIDFSYKSTGRLNNLTYLFSQNDSNNVQTQVVFEGLERQGLIVVDKNMGTVAGDNKNINILVSYSIKSLEKISSLLLNLTEKYRNDLRHSKSILYVNNSGIYFAIKPQQKYKAEKKRGQVIELLRSGSRKRKTLLEAIKGKNEKEIIDLISGINKVFANNVAGSPNAKIIIYDGQVYNLNTKDYDIKS